MSGLHYLYVSARGLLSMRWRSGALEVTGEFVRDDSTGEVSESVRLRFEALVHRHSGDDFVFIVDSVDEVQAVAQIPKVARRYRKDLIARRLAQQFRDCSLSTWLPIRPAQDARAVRANRQQPTPVLLCAIRSDQPLAPWVDIALRLRARIAAVHSPALLAGRLYNGRVARGATLVASLNPAGLRQTLVVDGCPKFSRLAAWSGPADFAAVTLELTRTLEYLIATQQVSRDALVDGSLRVLVSEAGLSDNGPAGASLHVESGGRVALSVLPAARVKWPRGFESAEHWTQRLASLPLWLKASRLRGCGAGYASHALRKFWLLAYARRWIQLTSAACVIVASGILGSAEFMSRLDNGTRAEMPSKALHGASWLARLERSVSEAPTDGLEMQRVVVAARQLRGRHVESIELLAPVSRALEATHGVALTSVQWGLELRGGQSGATSSAGAPDLSGAPAAAGARGPTSNGAASGPTGSDAPPPPPGVNTTGPAARASAGPFGQVPPSPGRALPAVDAETALTAPQSRKVRLNGEVDRALSRVTGNERTTAFATALEQECGCKSRIVRLPFEPSSRVAVTGSGQASPAARTFTIELEWPLPKEPGVLRSPSAEVNGGRRGDLG